MGNASIFLRRCQRTWALASDQIAPLNARNESSGDHPALGIFLDVASANPSVTTVPSPFREFCFPGSVGPRPKQGSVGRERRDRGRGKCAQLIIWHKEDEAQRGSHVRAMWRGEFQHPFYIHGSTGPETHIQFTVHFLEGRKRTSIFAAGRNPRQHPFYIHFTWENGCKMDVGGGSRMDVGFRPPGKMDVGFRAPKKMDVKWMCGSDPLEKCRDGRFPGKGM